jgi:hypothetical protein
VAAPRKQNPRDCRSRGKMYPFAGESNGNSYVFVTVGAMRLPACTRSLRPLGKRRLRVAETWFRFQSEVPQITAYECT